MELGNHIDLPEVNALVTFHPRKDWNDTSFGIVTSRSIDEDTVTMFDIDKQETTIKADDGTFVTVIEDVKATDVNTVLEAYVTENDVDDTIVNTIRGLFGELAIAANTLISHTEVSTDTSITQVNDDVDVAPTLTISSNNLNSELDALAESASNNTYEVKEVERQTPHKGNKTNYLELTATLEGEMIGESASILLDCLDYELVKANKFCEFASQVPSFYAHYHKAVYAVTDKNLYSFYRPLSDGHFTVQIEGDKLFVRYPESRSAEVDGFKNTSGTVVGLVKLLLLSIK